MAYCIGRILHEHVAIITKLSPPFLARDVAMIPGLPLIFLHNCEIKIWGWPGDEDSTIQCLYIKQTPVMTLLQNQSHSKKKCFANCVTVLQTASVQIKVLYQCKCPIKN